MLPLPVILAILLTHFLSDWIFQSREVAKTKSSNIKSLIEHVAIIFSCTGLMFIALGLNWFVTLVATLCYSLLHGLQDWKLYQWFPIPKDVNLVDYKPIYDITAIDQAIHLAALFYITAITLGTW